MEQETTVTGVRGEDYVLIWTANPVHLRKLRADDRAEEIRGDADSGEFKVRGFDPLKGFKRRVVLSEAERERRAASARERFARP